MAEDLAPDEVRGMTSASLRDAVRRRPGIFVGDPHDGTGVLQLALGLLGNAVDQALVGRCTALALDLHDDHSFTVTDDGPGIGTDASAGRSALPDVLVNHVFTPTRDGLARCGRRDRRPQTAGGRRPVRDAFVHLGHATSSEAAAPAERKAAHPRTGARARAPAIPSSPWPSSPPTSAYRAPAPPTP